MFENFTKSRPGRRGLRLLAIGSAAIHLLAGALLVILGLWEIEEVGRPHRGLAMATSMPAASAPAGEPKSTPERIKPKQRIVKEPRQPDPNKASEDLPSETDTASHSGSGQGDGPEDATGSGPGGPGLGLGIELCIDPSRCEQAALPVPTIAEPEKTPTLMPPTVLSQLRRTAGDPQVQPPSSTKNAMSRTGEQRIVAVVRMCLDTSGKVSAHNIVKSSGHGEYDARLLTAIRKWRYEPYRVGETPVAICTHLTFIYQQEE